MIDTEKANIIYCAMLELSGQFENFQTIGAIRDIVGSRIDRSEFDTLMIEMVKLDIVIMVPEENQKVITTADDHNAVRCLGMTWHLARLV